MKGGQARGKGRLGGGAGPRQCPKGAGWAPPPGHHRAQRYTQRCSPGQLHRIESKLARTCGRQALGGRRVRAGPRLPRGTRTGRTVAWEVGEGWQEGGRQVWRDGLKGGLCQEPRAAGRCGRRKPSASDAAQPAGWQLPSPRRPPRLTCGGVRCREKRPLRRSSMPDTRACGGYVRQAGGRRAVSRGGGGGRWRRSVHAELWGRRHRPGGAACSRAA